MKQTHPSPAQVKTANWRHVGVWWVETRRLMTLATSPWCQDVTQNWLTWARVDDMPWSPLPHTEFLKTLPWKPLECWVFWTLAVHSPCSAPCSKHCAFLYHNLVSVDWLTASRQADPSPGVVTLIAVFFFYFYIYSCNSYLEMLSSKNIFLN